MIIYNLEYLSNYENDFFPGPDYLYKGYNTNAESNGVIDLVEYHVNALPKFHDILDKSGRKVFFGGWLSVSMKLGERSEFF